MKNPDLNKVILTDCDGVLLNWEHGFHAWMKALGYKLIKGTEASYDISPRYGLTEDETRVLCRQFNTHARVGFLPPLRDAVKYVRKLHEEEGYVFHVITAQTLDPYAQKLRIRNLTDVFGADVFERFAFTECGADKRHVLEEYKDSGYLWIEDKMENLVIGRECGLESVAIKHPYNEDAVLNFPYYSNWRELYNDYRSY